MEDPSALIIPLALTALICLVVGVFIGLLLASLRSPREKNRPAQNRELAEIVRIWQHKRDKNLVLEIDGQQYTSRGDLSVARHGRLVSLLNSLQLWLGVQGTEARSEPRSPESQPTSPEGVATAQLAPLPILSAQPAEGKPKFSLNPIDVLVRAAATDVPQDATAPLSIAAQIDEILQEKLLDHPLHERGIRLMELPERGLVVMVGVEEFDGVGDVPYPEIQALLRECVAEWERRIGT